ncbi:hypothetical protein F5Y10DRAFT_265385 [Nemania abortiva]|nr:hypothetical protein F5Y10DRAFT_265385 [Nemania abortiva]
MKATVVSLLSLASIGAANPLGNFGVEVKLRSPPSANGIQFDCNVFPDICSSMCWGAYCVPSSTDFLTYDKPSKPTKRERRKAAGCIDNIGMAGSNRCSNKRPGTRPGYNCDEYPFASSKADSSSGKENRCSRCVPSSQNSKQGAVLAKGYKGFCKNQAPCNFQVFFGNPGATGAEHCEPGNANNCAADNDELCSGSINIIQRAAEYAIEPLDIAKRDMYTNGTYVPGPARFRTYGGKVLDAPYGGTIGQAVHTPRPVDEELHEKLIDAHVYDEDGDEDQFDEIIANMVSDVDYLKEVVWQGHLKE